MPPEHKYSLPRGLRLRQYVIVSLLGHGGFGLTYLAEDTSLNRKVAIKELLPTDFAIREKDGTTVVERSHQDGVNFRWAQERFLEEGRTLAQLHHASILPIYDIFEDHGTAYIVTAFIEGESLAERWRHTPRPSEKDLRAIALSLLDALALVHESGYLHRDVKPDNILMARQTGRPILIDFGNARIAAGEKTSSLTAVLTKGYAPFEQYQTKGRQGPYTDLYALGAVFYRAITGVPPEDAADRWESDKVALLSQQMPPGYSREFLAAVDKALKMRREDRWQTCAQWQAALSPSIQSKYPVPGPSPRPSRLIPILASLALLILACFGMARWTHGLFSPSHSTEASQPLVNSLGMKFVPVEIPGRLANEGRVLFSVWDTRVSDWEAFIQNAGDTPQSGIWGNDSGHDSPDPGKIGWYLRPDLSWSHPGFAQTGEHPVVGVNIEDARRFCAWLSKKEGRTYRLPTNAEWSVAVGKQTYPWGGTFPPPMGAGNYSGIESRLTLWGGSPREILGYDDGFPRTSPVGSFTPNRYGLYDMGGNVAQWCDEEYERSMNSPEVVESNPFLKREIYQGIRVRVIRGASWGDYLEESLRSTFCVPCPPGDRRSDCGFRCVLVEPGQAKAGL